MQIQVLAVVLALTACKSESKQKPPPPTPEPAPAEAAQEIAKQPLTPMAAKTGFLEFTIELPPAASVPHQGDKATVWDFKDSKLTLKVTEVSTMPTQSGMKGQPPPQDGEKVTRTITDVPGGYWVNDRKNDATGFRAEYCMDLDPSSPPSGLCCEMDLRTTAPIVDLDKLIAFASRVCPSIKLTNRTVPPPGSGSAAK